jgi:hypothetical protein
MRVASLQAIAATGRDRSKRARRTMRKWSQFHTFRLVVVVVCAAFAAIVLAGSATAAPRATAGSASVHRAVAPATARAPRKRRNSAKKKGGGLGQAECSSLIGTWCYYAFINDTPFVMHLLPPPATHAWYHDRLNDTIVPDNFDRAPASTLQPGQNTVFGFQEGLYWNQAAIYWYFYDFEGKPHRADYNIDQNGNPLVYSIDGGPTGPITQSVATFHIAPDSDGHPNDLDAVLSKPADDTIDADKEPATAAAVMKLFSDGANKSFTSTTGLSFSDTHATQASAVTIHVPVVGSVVWCGVVSGSRRLWKRSGGVV